MTVLQEEALSQRTQLEALFAKDTADAFRVFDTLEHFLCQPEHLRGQLQVQLGYDTQVSKGLKSVTCWQCPLSFVITQYVFF